MAVSAGLLLFRQAGLGWEVLLVHPGGPYYAKKDLGAWSIPKGLINEGEDRLSAAAREFEEETGFQVELKQPIELGSSRVYAGKELTVWAVEGDADPALLRSNSFTLEWPPRSGRHQDFPEADRAFWFRIDQARQRIHKGQVVFLDRLSKALRRREDEK